MSNENQENKQNAVDDLLKADETSGKVQMSSSPEPAIAQTEPKDTSEAEQQAPENTEYVLKRTAENADQTFITSTPRTAGAPDVVVIPPENTEVIRESLANTPNLDILKSGGQMRWLETVKEAVTMTPMSGMYTKRLADTKAAFAQKVEYGGQILRGVAPSLNPKPGRREEEGEMALIKLMTHMGVGGFFRAPLWNSGIWVMFKPASEDELDELNRIIYSDKVQLGRWSYGLALGNSTVYTLDRVFDFCLSKVYQTSVRTEELPLEKLRDYILPQDAMSFIWGFLCANYPSGFHYETPCINDPSKCTHVFEENLNVTKLQWADSSMLTESQKAHMCGFSGNSKSLESVKKYQEEMKATKSRRVVLNEGTKHEVAFVLKTPTMTEYITQGHQWVSSIVEAVNRALGSNATDRERNDQITRQSKAATICQYAHWIESLEYGEITANPNNPDDNAVAVIRNQETLLESLKSLSSIDSIRNKIIDAVKDYIEESTVSIIGVPAYTCPVCQKDQVGETKYPRRTTVIPLDILQVFFALLIQRLSRIENR